MKKFTIISDPGIDDIMALVLLYKLSPQAQNCLVSTFGNAAEEFTSKTAKEFIAFVANSWSFMHGSNKPLSGKVEHDWPDYFHGKDGIWGVHPDISTRYIKSLNDYPKNRHTISLAPMTDVFNLLKQRSIKEITVMGGAFNVEGNETGYAETNIAFDPDAAHHFFEESRGIDTKVISLDVTRKAYWIFEDVKNIPETNKINILLKKILMTWFENYSHEREENFNLHDPLAVYLTFYPEEAKWYRSGVKVITDGAKRGQTCFDKKNPICNVAVDLDDANMISKDIFNRIFKSNGK